jgi:hypothetical protein
MQLAVIATTLLAGTATSRMFGPLVLVPTLIATFTIVLQAHPQRRMRLATGAMGLVAMVVPMLLELAGVLPASYRFADGAMVILPQMHELPAGASIGLLLGTSLAMLIVPCMFIARLREALSEAQTRWLLQAWHFRRLGDQLIDATAPR